MASRPSQRARYRTLFDVDHAERAFVKTVASGLADDGKVIVDAQPKQFAALFDEFKAHGNAAKEKMLATFAQKPTRPDIWDGTGIVSLKDKPVLSETRGKIEAADGMLTDTFALT